MGCDIHCYIEYRDRDVSDLEDKSWSSFGGRINPGRNYAIFSLMAGVRSWNEGNILFEPRGLAENLGYYSRGDNFLYITADEKECSCGGSCDSVSMSKAEKWVKSGSSYFKNNREGKPTWVSQPDWHSHSWLSLSEFRQVLEKYKEVEQREWEELEKDRVELLNKVPENEREQSWLYKPYAHATAPGYQAMEAAMSRYEELGYESRLVFWFDN